MILKLLLNNAAIIISLNYKLKKVTTKFEE